MKTFLIFGFYLIANNVIASEPLLDTGQATSEAQTASVSEQSSITQETLEEMLIKAELEHGKHAEQLLPILEKLVVITQKNAPEQSRAYNRRRTQIYLRHNSSDFIAQFKDSDLATTHHSKKMLKRVSRLFKSEFQLHETPHWSIIYHHTQEKRVVNKIAPHMEKTYDSALSFLVSFGFRNKPLDKKMTAIYFPSKDDYIKLISKLSSNKVAKNSGGIYLQDLNTLAFFDYGEGKKNVSPSTVAHESAHQIMYNAGLQLNAKNQPRWFIEGLASAFEPMDRTREFGPHTNNYSSRRMHVINQLTKKNEIPSITDIVASSFKDEYQTKGNANKTYAMGSMLVRYLYKYHPDKLKDYLKVLAESKQTRSANGRKKLFSKAFGDPELIQPNFKNYVNDALIEFKALRKKRKNKT